MLLNTPPANSGYARQAIASVYDERLIHLPNESKSRAISPVGEASFSHTIIGWSETVKQNVVVMTNETRENDSIETEPNPKEITLHRIRSEPEKDRREFDELTARLEPKLEQLDNHPVARRVSSLNDVRIFLEWQGYAVLAYLNTVSALHNHRDAPPWYPPLYADELEESITRHGVIQVSPEHRVTKFDIVYQALDSVQGNLMGLDSYVDAVAQGRSLDEALDEAVVSRPIRDYMTTAWDIAQQGEPHRTAGAIAFGMRSILPDGFGGKVRRIFFDDTAFVPQSDVAEANERDSTFYQLNYPLEFDAERHEYFYPGAIVETEQTKEDALESAKRMMDARLPFLDALEDELA